MNNEGLVWGTYSLNVKDVERVVIREVFFTTVTGKCENTIKIAIIT